MTKAKPSPALKTLIVRNLVALDPNKWVERDSQNERREPEGEEKLSKGEEKLL